MGVSENDGQPMVSVEREHIDFSMTVDGAKKAYTIYLEHLLSEDDSTGALTFLLFQQNGQLVRELARLNDFIAQSVKNAQQMQEAQQEINPDEMMKKVQEMLRKMGIEMPTSGN